KSCPKVIEAIIQQIEDNKKLAQSGDAAKYEFNQKLTEGQLTLKKFEQETQGGALIACAVCGRTFFPDRIAKHQQTCRKNYINKV
ncbi:MAG: hypothetical protein EZS28_018319, partial [Streblomastix strix]